MENKKNYFIHMAENLIQKGRPIYTVHFGQVAMKRVSAQVKENIQPERRYDRQEVQNYILAMNRSIEQLKTLPLSNRLIRNAHKTLLRGVRSDHKLPGEFRKSQNRIGGNSLADAVFIPPYYEGLPDLMSDFEKFLHNDRIALPKLIKIGITHYQFETIHPFFGRERQNRKAAYHAVFNWKKMLAKPTLYLSDYYSQVGFS